MGAQKILLFLDFDGVMHAVDDPHLFGHEEHLARVLTDFPTVEIVISSAWRKTNTLANMKKFFLTDLRARVVGVTPVFRIGEANTSVTPGARYHEIQRYLAASCDPGRPWIALDDDPVFFPPGCAELVLCDPKFGFGPGAEVRLRAALTALI
ncbi:HAD domain-containing protein [Rhodoferax ferrireducens]|nr:HAD domain-containing protein [Rhodoferax ferrireducens]